MNIQVGPAARVELRIDLKSNRVSLLRVKIADKMREVLVNTMRISQAEILATSVGVCDRRQG
jgi:hypothetical protein